MFPLTRTLSPNDYTELEPELWRLRQADPNLLDGQDPARAWEYGLALRAIDQWQRTRSPLGMPPRRALDVGGAGSHWGPVLMRLGWEVSVIDPNATEPWGTSLSLAAYVRSAPRLTPVVTCISVLEHVEDLDEFVYHLGCLVAPGGLLVLTMDYWDQTGQPDTAHFHWMRRRIFDGLSFTTLRRQLERQAFHLLGLEDATYHGPQVEDYTFASLVLVKRY